MTEAIVGLIGAVIGAVGTIIAALITSHIGKSKKNTDTNSGIRFMIKGENPCALVPEVSHTRMFSINSYVLYNYTKALLSQNPDLTIPRITLIVRQKPDESASDINELKKIISYWHKLVTENRILSLKIISTPHDSNHYYSIMGDELMYLGLIYHDDHLPTNTDVDYFPVYFPKDSIIGKQMIQKYQTHFDHTVQRFEKENTIYDSSSPQKYMEFISQNL